MKKFLVISLFFVSVPVFATCMINNMNACSVAELTRSPMQSSFSNSETTLPNYISPSAVQQPSTTEVRQDSVRDFGVQSSDYSYNTSCQFGICNEGGATRLFESRTSR